MVNRLTALMVGLPLVLLASPAASETYVGPGPSTCAAEAHFSGSSLSIRLKADGNGNPVKGSHIAYGPAGNHIGFAITAEYPLSADRSVTAPSSLLASATVSRHDAYGSFVLTLGGQDFRSSPPGMKYTGDPQLRGNAQVLQYFGMTGSLVDALAAGGPGRLAYIDTKGAVLVQADLTFAPKTAIQGATEKAYPTALALAIKKAQC